MSARGICRDCCKPVDLKDTEDGASVACGECGGDNWYVDIGSLMKAFPPARPPIPADVLRAAVRVFNDMSFIVDDKLCIRMIAAVILADRATRTLLQHPRCIMTSAPDAHKTAGVLPDAIEAAAKAMFEHLGGTRFADDLQGVYATIYPEGFRTLAMIALGAAGVTNRTLASRSTPSVPAVAELSEGLALGVAGAAEGNLLTAAKKALAFYDGLDREHDPGEAAVLDALDTAVRAALTASPAGDDPKALDAEARRSPPMANPSPDERVRATDLHDLITHRAAWRNALVIAKEHAEVSPPDVDDKGYWQHEIDVFDRTFAALSTPVPVIPMGTGDADEAYEIGKRDGYEKAVQDIDCLTGGDGEYTCVLGSDIDGRHCPDADSMKTRIVERFEGLPRGTASAAEGGPAFGGWTPCRIEPPRRRPLLTLWQSGQQQVLYRADYEGTVKDDWRNLDGTASGVWPIAWRELPEASRELRQQLTDLAFSRASTEPGDGVASAFPSPLPSQGEDGRLAEEWAEFEDDNDLIMDGHRHIHYARAQEAFASAWPRGLDAAIMAGLAALAFPPQGEPVADLIAALQAACETAWANSSAIGLFKAAAEDLAAERAKREYAEAALALTSGRLEAAEARADRAKEALKPFVEHADAFSHLNEEVVIYGSGGLKITVGNLLRARTILKETPHGER